MPDDPDLTIPGPLRMVWRLNSGMDGGWHDLMMGRFRLGVVAGDIGPLDRWQAWLTFSTTGNSHGTQILGWFPTETAARAALVAAVREAVTT